MKRIIVDYGVVKRLVAEGLGSKPTVIAALRCRSNTEKACRIRQRALQLGGVVMEAERTAQKERKEA